MDSNCNAAQGQGGAATGLSSGIQPDSNANHDWRSRLQPDARQIIVNRIMDTLKRHFHVPVPEGLTELQKTAVLFEEKIYSAANSQSDYLRKVSLKMLSLETKALPELNAFLNKKPIDPAALMHSTASTGQPGDWQEETYQKLKYLKDAYFADLREIHRKLSIKLSQLDSVVHQARGAEQIEKMKHFKVVLERMMTVLSLGKDHLQIGLKDKLPLYENQILSVLRNRIRVPHQQPQAGVPSDQTQFLLQQSQPGMQSQQPLRQQQQQQSNISAIARSNILRMPNVMQQGIQNTLQSDQLLTNGTGLGHPAERKSRKCKICGDCAHKRRNPME